MNNPNKTYQVVIVGGGPVGLFLGLCFRQADISCLILEKRTEIRKGSRSLGIHPVSLELFDKLGIAGDFTERGIKIQQGHAFANEHNIGTLSFSENCPKPFNYILALPQYLTETLLQQHVNNTGDNLLIRGAEVADIRQDKERVKVSYLCDGQTNSLSTRFLVGCDGKHSFVRKQTGISFEGTTYPDTYVMGDFSDNTSLGADAAIFLCDEGLIESFPLLNRKRRWVVKTDQYLDSPHRQDIEKRIANRIGCDLSGTENIMLSSFGVQKLLAKPMVKNRIILAGDAAHVVSPIGGQGMNLGWLGAWDLSQSLKEALNDKSSSSSILDRFEKRRYKAARNAIRRAELNMRLGRKPHFPTFRNKIVSLMLNTPLATLMARIFTMRGIERWIL